MTLIELKITNAEKQAIRKHWSYTKIRFRKDGTVEGMKGSSWGILYTENQLKGHLKILRDKTGE